MNVSQNFTCGALFDVLQAAIPGNSAVGEDPRVTASSVTLYRRLRDARSLARTAERRRQQAEDPGERVALCPEWQEVSALAREILTDHAKDIEVLVWLTESETRISGFAGARSALSLMQTLVAEYGTAMHGLESETDCERFAPIGALSGVGGEGTLIQPIRLLPLLPEAAYGEHSLWELEHGSGATATQAALAAADRRAMAIRLAEIDACIASAAALDAQLTEMFGADAPPLARLKDVLGEAAAAVRHWSGLSDAPAAVSDETHNEGTIAVSEAAEQTVRHAAPEPIRSRDEAFRQLLEIAAFFRRTEPHSPTSDAIETLVRRGQMDFMSLLAELVPDEGMRLSVMTKAGIEPPKNEK
ncbi:MAG: type VI secretion system protein TssA [Pseudomonadota bacterium]